MAMATEMTDERLAAIKATVEKAHRELGEVCSAGVSRRWRISIPADFTRDSDLIIGDGLRGANELAAEVERLRLALARLSAVPAADVERMREALAIRERQLSYAVAGMGQGKEPTFFAVKDEAGRVHDVVMAKSSATHGCVQPAELAPTTAPPKAAALASPASGAAAPTIKDSLNVAAGAAETAEGGANVGDVALGLYWARHPAGSWEPNPCRVVLGNGRKIHGKVPPEAKVVMWMGGDAVSSLAELLEDGWRFFPLANNLPSPPSPAPACTAEATEPWIPFLGNRADGVRGHYAIGRIRPDGTAEYWNVVVNRWSAFSDGALTLDEARELLKRMTFAATTPTDAYREGRAHGDEVAAVRELATPGAEREAALEEAAQQALREQSNCNTRIGRQVCRGIAAAIRALKSQPAPAAPTADTKEGD
jgi:hypothetical protein